MKIEIEELPDSIAGEIRSLLRMVYEAGRAKGREEAKPEQQGIVGPPDAAAEEQAGRNSKDP